MCLPEFTQIIQLTDRAICVKKMEDPTNNQPSNFGLFGETKR